MKTPNSCLRKMLQYYTVVVVGLVLPLSPLEGRPTRITGHISNEERVVLRGNVNPKAQPQFDKGPVEPSMKLPYITLMLKPSAGQQAALEQLLTEQQDRTSSQYHKWLTPEQYADRFGLSHGDIGKVKSWLESQGFSIDHVALSRNWLAFTGTAVQVAKTFQTEIHHYSVDGETHFANATEPTIPAALESLVIGFLGLGDFHPKAPRSRANLQSSVREDGRETPNFAIPGGLHLLAPDDVATIYDITRLYEAGLDGSGERIAVAGQSSIDIVDIATFRLGARLPANVPQVLLVPGSQDPGKTDAQGEADLDVEWVGAVARKATIIYVYSMSALVAVGYAISQNLAPIISFSFGSCEKDVSDVSGSFIRSQAQQANSHGITWIVSSGDSGAAGCDKPFSSPKATQGLAVSFPASIPEVTAVGGTGFADQGNNWGGNYWSTTNSSTNASALSYIPEIAWNDSRTVNVLAASAGGLSARYPQPPWQIGPGVSSTKDRAVPDIALAASVTSDSYVTITGGQVQPVGGTSAATPVFAGMVALLNQHEASNGEGNINPNLYRLAQTNGFHDIVSGNNIVPCVVGTPNCVNGFLGYPAGPGYDLVTGLGSVDAYNLVAEWNAPTPQSKVVPSCTPNPVYEQQPDAEGYSWFYTVILTEKAGVGTNLTGFTFNGADYSSKIVDYFGSSTLPGNSTIAANLEAKDLTGPTNVGFGFTGVDAGGRQWSQQLSVPFGRLQSSTVQPSIAAVVNSASYQPGISPGALATLFGKNLSPVVGIEMPGGATSYKQVSVSVGGRVAPLFSVANVNGMEQINFQIPMGLNSSGPVPVQVNYNGSVGTFGVSVTQVQPGSFEYVPVGSSTSYAAVLKPDGSTSGPSSPVSRGTTVAMFLTGLGSTSPSLETSQPGPVPPAITDYEPDVTLNGFSAPIAFSGAAPGFIGLEQINFVIPSGVPVGSSIVLSVSANGVASQNSRIAVQ
jgi:uncharacterized protein (TIGR03437 family)